MAVNGYRSFVVVLNYISVLSRILQNGSLLSTLREYYI